VFHRSRVAAFVSVFATATCLCIGGSTASSGAIGLATTQGVFTVDNAQVQGNAALLDGSLIQTSQNPSQVTLQGGARVDLATQSTSRIYRDHVVLEKGVSRAKGVPVVVNGLKVVPTDASSVIQVSTDGTKRFSVGATNGRASVLNSKGALIAEVMRGSAMSFAQTDAGAGAPSQITGCVQRIRGTSNYVIRDETTNVIYQVQGPDVEANVGKSVQITGSLDTTATPVTGSSQVIHETALTPNTSGKSCRSDVAAAADAAGAAAAAVGGGISGATIAIVAGVAVAGIVGGLAAAGTFSSGNNVSGQVSP